MKKLILAALAATVVATPVIAQAQPGPDNRGGYDQRHDDRSGDRRDDRGYDHRDNRGPDRRDDRRDDRFAGRHDFHGDRGPQYRSWNRGDRFDYRYARDYRVIDRPYDYRLHAAPRGYRWVRSGNDAVLIGITTGIVASVLAGAIR